MEEGPVIGMWGLRDCHCIFQPSDNMQLSWEGEVFSVMYVRQK